MIINKFNDEEYLKYSQNKEDLFYSSPYIKDTLEARTDFSIADYQGENWENFADEYWFYMNNKKIDFPSQGWKIHITSTLEDADNLLYDVSELLIPKNISFKFAPNIEALEYRNSKYANRGESGKFITIYPWNDDCFFQLLDQLKKITDIYSLGPYILNDKQWKNSNVFFRYGGLKRIQHVIDGRDRLCIQTPNGDFVEDQRVPFYYLPSFVKEPLFLTENNIFPKKEIFNQIDMLKITEALHFSNSGGVYQIVIDGKKSILKEGRNQAGLDANGRDGFTRTKNEYAVLRRLSNVAGVIHAHQYFVTWHNNYFIEDFVNGENLHQFVARSFPFNYEDDAKGKTAQYSHICQKILSDLVKILTKIHHKGIAVGDLSLNNIMISFGEGSHLYQKLTLIDFETASPSAGKSISGLVTPGFYSDKVKTALEGDWFALYKISRKLFLPINSVTDLAPKLKFVQDQLIKDKFGQQTVDFLLQLEQKISQHTNIFLGSPWISKQLAAPQVEISKNNVDFYQKQLAKGIIVNLHLDDPYLTSGDLNQYDQGTGNYNIAYGGFGVLLSLKRYAGKDIVTKNPKIKKWLDSSIAQIMKLSMTGKQGVGLFTGLSGIATAMYELGYEREALSIAHNINIELLSNNKDISVFSGYAGLGLFFLSFYNSLGGEEYLNNIMHIHAALMLLYEEENESNIEKNSGFMTGWLGVALFFWEFSLLLDDKHSSDVAITILRKSFKTLSAGENNEDNLYVSDNQNKLNPYLTNGSAGVALVMLEMLKDGGYSFSDYELNIFNELKKTNSVFCSYNGGLINGYLGLLVLENGLHATKQAGNNVERTKELLNNLNHYIVADPSNDSFLFPGDDGFKFSMDVSTGSAGAIAVLNDVGKDTWGSWFPVLMDHNRLFSR